MTTSPRTTTFRIHTVGTAPAGSQPILDQLQKQVGFLPNLAASMAESPTLLDGFTSLRRIAGGGTLDPVAREVVALAVSFENRCSYCMAAHSTFASSHGAPEALLSALREGRPVDDPRYQALSSFASAVVTNAGPLTTEQKRQLLDAGFTPAQMLEVLAVIGMTSLANWAHHVTEAPVDDAFASQEWKISARHGAPASA
jgi:uncharacterized peroxidase-related enzyme